MIPILNVDLTQLVSNMVLVQYTIKTNIGTLASNASNMLRLVQGEGVDRIVWFRFKKNNLNASILSPKMHSFGESLIWSMGRQFFTIFLH